MEDEDGGLRVALSRIVAKYVCGGCRRGWFGDARFFEGMGPGPFTSDSCPRCIARTSTPR